MRLFQADHKADRSEWKSGPWDNEPDYYAWTTRAGFPAYMGRLPSGAWAGGVIAPQAPEVRSIDTCKFYSKLTHMGHAKDKEFSMGHSSPTNTPGIIDYCCSAEHWESPGPSNRTWWRGPYKTLEEFKERCENLADAILALHNDPNLYKDW